MPLIPCPECQREVSTFAASCPQCGYPMQAPQSHVAARSVANPVVGAALAQVTVREPLQEIAYWQKLLLYGVVFNLLSLFPVSALISTDWFAWLGWLWSLGLFVFAAICFVQLGRALRMPWPVLAFYSLGLPFPGVSLLVMVILVQRANKSLKQAGVPVGLMGAKLRSLPG